MIEVLVALAIFAGTVVLALSSLQFQLHRQHKITQQHLAAQLSNNTVADLQLGARSWPNNETNYPITFSDIEWEVKLIPVASPANNWQRLRIEVIHEDRLLAEQSVYRQSTSGSSGL